MKNQVSFKVCLKSSALVFLGIFLSLGMTYASTLEDQLHLAILENDEALVQQLIDNGANVNALDPNGITPLCLALAEPGSNDVITVLLENGADKNLLSANPDDFTQQINALHFAIYKGKSKPIIEELCIGSAVLNQVQPLVPYDSVTPLGLAAIRGDASIIQLLIGAGADPDVVNTLNAEFEGIPLHFTTFYHYDIDLTDYLAKESANDIPGKFMGYENVTPILIAAFMGRSDLVEELADNGENINAMTLDGATAEILAAFNNHDLTSQLVIEMRNYTTAEREIAEMGTIPFYAQQDNNPMILSYLFPHDLLNHQSVIDETILNLVNAADSTATLHVVFQEGISLNRTLQFQNGYQGTALHLAAMADNKVVISYLINGGANVDVQDSNGITPVIQAALANSVDAFSALLAANVNLTSHRSLTSSECNSIFMKPEVYQLLKEAGWIGDSLCPSNDLGSVCGNPVLIETNNATIEPDSNGVFSYLSATDVVECLSSGPSSFQSYWLDLYVLRNQVLTVTLSTDSVGEKGIQI